MCLLDLLRTLAQPDPVLRLTAIIVSRFFLNLRDVKDTPCAGTGDDVEASAPSVSNLHFASAIVGNMGAELNGSFGIGTRVDDLDEEEEEESEGFEDAGEIEEVPRSAVAEVAP